MTVQEKEQIVRGVHKQSRNGTQEYPLCNLGMGLTAQITMVGPEFAEQALAMAAPQQRHLSESNIDMITREITDGAWILTGQTIIFDRDGHLLNGRHTLHAIAKAGQSVPILVVRGVGDRAYPVMDQGETRKGKDNLDALGYKRTRVLSSAATLLFHYVKGTLNHARHKTRLSAREIGEFVQQHPDLPDSVRMIRPPTSKIFRSHAGAAFCHYVLSKVDAEDAVIFFDKVVEGTMLGPKNPILLLRNRLINRKDYRLDPSETARLVFKAWNDFRDGREVSKLTLSSSDEFPVPH